LPVGDAWGFDVGITVITAQCVTTLASVG